MQRVIITLLAIVTAPIWIPIIVVKGTIIGCNIANQKLKEKYSLQNVGVSPLPPMTPPRQCEHEFFWADNKIYPKNPPERKMVCKKCGKIAFIAGVIHPVVSRN